MLRRVESHSVDKIIMKQKKYKKNKVPTAPQTPNLDLGGGVLYILKLKLA